MSDSIFIPQAIFFDTNPLLAAGWPNPSAQLLSLLDQMDRLNMMYCLPDVVSVELMEHTLRKIKEDWNQARTQVTKVMKKVSSIQPLASLPKDELIREELEKRTSDFTERFITVPMSSRPLSEFVDMAINRGATFTDGGEGFQDAVILCSILDYLKEHQFSAAVIVSNDKAFQNAGVEVMGREAGVTLKIANTVDDAEKLLKGYMNASWRAYMKQEHTKLLNAFDSMKGDLEKFLAENLTVSLSDLNAYGSVKQIKHLSLLSINDVHPPLLSEDDDGNSVRVSAEVKVRLELDIERFDLPALPRLKVGGAVRYSAPDTSNSLFDAIRDLNARHREMVAVVEAEATRTNEGYSNIRLTGASLKKESLWGLVSGMKSESKEPNG